jgi:Fe-S cluster assembly ATPase SufC
VALAVQEPVRIEGVRVREVLRVVHDVVQAAEDGRAFRDDVLADLGANVIITNLAIFADFRQKNS